MNVDVKILDQTSGALTAYFSNRLSSDAAILDLQYECARIGGCSSLTMLAKRVGNASSIACGNKVEVWVADSSGVFARKYLGVILSIDENYKKETCKIKAWGLWHQFEYQIVVKYIEGATVDTIIDTIFDSFQTNTYCDATPSISIASPATLGDVEVDFQPASEIIRKLAEVQGDIDYGVDEDGIFYFRDTTATKRGHFQIGVNVSDFRSSERADEMYNDVYLKTKGLVSVGNLILHEDNDTSIAAYKKRSQILEAPELSEISDALAWAQNKLESNSSPVKEYSFIPIVSAGTYFPYTGNVALVDSDGSAIGTFNLESATYNFDSSGLSHELSVGDSNAEFDAAKLLSNLDRKLRIAEVSNISNSRIQHSGYDEFKQYVQQNSLESNLYNIFTQDFSDSDRGITKTIDRYTNAYIISKRRTKVDVPLNWDFHYSETVKTRVIKSTSMSYPAIIETGEIPTGRILDTVRIYYDIDQFGRYEFQDVDSVQDWRNESCSDTTKGGYLIDNTADCLKGNKDLSEPNRGTLWLQPKNWVRELVSGDLIPEYYNQSIGEELRFRVNDISGAENDIVFQCYFNYKPGAPINFADFSIVILAGGGIRFYLKKYLNSALITTDYFDLPGSTDYIVELLIASTFVLARAYNTDYELQDFMSIAMDAQSLKRFTILTMQNSDRAGETGNIGIQWLEIGSVDKSNRIVLECSRDGGTTWESFTPDDINGFTYHDFDLSGQPDGTGTIKVKATLTWPGSLYGFAASWGGD
jgi:hypothetical protein